MTTRRPRRSARPLVAGALLVAACGGGDPATEEAATGGDTAGGSPSTVPTTADPTVPVDTTAVETTTTVVVPDLDEVGELADSECAADDEGQSAADTFDAAGLSATGQSAFVPLDDPEMVVAAEVDWLDPDDPVLGIVHESGETQAYPVDQMAYHHIANTWVAGEPYLVTY